MSGCVVTAQTSQPCQDGNQCTNDDICTQDGCVGQAAENCNCQQDGDCTLYDDNDLCTGIVRCLEGSCQVDPTSVVTCPLPGEPCINIQCAPETGECVTNATTGACTDGDLCTHNDECVDGVCEAEPLTCDDGDECTTDLCLPSIGCVVEFIPDCQPKGCKEGAVGLCGACGQRVCTGGVWGICQDEKTCVAGATETAPCGNCGQKTRTCNETCEWNEWNDCQGQKVCTPGQGESQACGACGSQQRNCTNDCSWGDWSNCSGQGACEPGTIGDCDQGDCDGTKACNNNCAWETCVMEPVCCGDGKCTSGAETCNTCPQDCPCYPNAKAVYRYYWYDDSGGQLKNANHMVRTVKDTAGYDYKGNHYDYEGKHFELFASDNGPDLKPLYQSYKASPLAGAPNHLPSITSDAGSDLGYTGHKVIGYCSSKQTPETPKELTRVYANQLTDHFATTNPAGEVAAGDGYYVQGGHLCWVP